MSFINLSPVSLSLCLSQSHRKCSCGLLLYENRNSKCFGVRQWAGRSGSDLLFLRDAVTFDSQKISADMELLPLLSLSFCFLTLSGLTFGAESVTSVIVKEDDDAILPCSLGTNENIESMVFDWKKEETVQVFVYNKGAHDNNGLTDQNEQFKSRVTHFPEELKHGNASIRIKETKREDKGNYTCFFPNSRKILKVELVVGAAPKPYVKVLKEKGLLECEVPGAYPKPTVEWQDSDNKTLNSKTLQDIEDKDRFYITIQTRVTKPGCYRCVATQMTKWHQIPSETCVHDEKIDLPSQGPNTGLIVAVVVLAVALVVAGILAFQFKRNHSQHIKEGAGTPLSSETETQH